MQKKISDKILKDIRAIDALPFDNYIRIKRKDTPLHNSKMFSTTTLEAEITDSYFGKIIVTVTAKSYLKALKMLKYKIISAYIELLEQLSKIRFIKLLTNNGKYENRARYSLEVVFKEGKAGSYKEFESNSFYEVFHEAYLHVYRRYSDFE